MVKNLPSSAGAAEDMDSSLGLGRFFKGGNGNPLQYSYQDNPKDRGAWQAIVHGAAKNQTQLNTYAHIRQQQSVSRIESILNGWQILWNCPVRGEQNYPFSVRMKRVKKAYMNYSISIIETTYALLESQKKRRQAVYLKK